MSLFLHALFARDKDTEYCTLATCPIQDSFYNYLPSAPANGLYLGIFSLSLCLYLLQGLLSKRWLGFTISMVAGCICEILGYIGRLMSHHNPFSQNGFLMQIVCLTIAPAFMAASIYLTLSRIIRVFGPGNSRLSPSLYPKIFIPCDFFSLVLQAIGGGMASGASHSNKSPASGDHVMVAGLAFQVFTLLLFMLLATDFAVRTLSRMRRLGADGALDPTHARLRASYKFRGFLVALTLATVCIFVRSVYRVAELSEGWEGALIKNQKLFIGFEGAIVGVAVLVLNVFHPAYCFGDGGWGGVAGGEVRGDSGVDGVLVDPASASDDDGGMGKAEKANGSLV
ncbi:MAG: hypothetical protein M1819_004600 [Sarea resinae]|nr:MAG: hypothetical protein M1819_006797 [Sarea resinae]KAI9828275.1 MAG: hypothetical protein M1819_006613 [Sarea resinae]KAI9832056.1 MAG: hypothetical protein M1819_004600 [Sarea resinae]